MQLEKDTELLPLDGGSAIDYFVMRKADAHICKLLPEFVIGTHRWDNVFLRLFFTQTNATIIDATRAAPIQHQLQSPGDHLKRVGGKYNDKLAHQFMGNDFHKGSIDKAHIQLISLKRTRRLEKKFFYFEIPNCDLLKLFALRTDLPPPSCKKHRPIYL